MCALTRFKKKGIIAQPSAHPGSSFLDRQDVDCGTSHSYPQYHRNSPATGCGCDVIGIANNPGFFPHSDIITSGWEKVKTSLNTLGRFFSPVTLLTSKGTIKPLYILKRGTFCDLGPCDSCKSRGI